MGAVVVDAGVVIGWLDREDVHHAAATAALDELSGEDLSIPASAYAEVLVRPVATGTFECAREAIAAFGLGIGPIDAPAAEAAAALRARHPSLRLPDALVLGYADAIDADAALTTDERWVSVSARARLVA